MHFLHIFYLLSSTLLATAVNTPNYEAASAAAAQKGVHLLRGHTYAFKSHGGNGHVRLIVGTVFPLPSGLDFWADSFEMVLTSLGRYGRLYKGAGVKVGHQEGWDCERPQNFRYKGEAMEYTPAEIVEKGHQILVKHKETYNIVTNNCRTFVWELFRKIKLRGRRGTMRSMGDCRGRAARWM